MKGIFLFFALTIFMYSNAQNVSGDWKGSLDVNGTEIPIIFHLHTDASGNTTGDWDSPLQNLSGLKYSSVKVLADSLLLRMDQIGAHFSGKFVSPDSVEGTWFQGGASLPLNIKRSATTVIKEVYPNEKEISIKMRDGYPLEGTLLAKNNSEPLVLILAGSGPTDRNGNSAMGLATDSYLLLAHALDSQNIATFRFDKRGVAASLVASFKEDSLGFDDYINDAEDIIDYLRKLGFKKIVIAGHSEGSLIGMIVAKKKKVPGFISIDGAGRPINEVLTEQISKNISDSSKMELTHIMDSFSAGKMVDNLPAQWSTIFRKSVQPYLISWMKYNPVKAIQMLNCPVLIIQGTCDIQVPRGDADNLAKALPKAKLVVIKNMSHTLKDVGENCEMQQKSYVSKDVPLSVPFVKAITEFVKTVAK